MAHSADAGRLCVSVIEARNVQADTTSGLDFYVKVRVGLTQAKTDVCTNSPAPKFLKDLRLDVPNPHIESLMVELIQQGERGDLVIGKESIRIASVMNKGTLVTWLPLISVDGDCAAELCLVMRYLQANAGRPMTPSYGITAREQRERALGASEPASKPAVSKALFSDLPQSDPGTQTPSHNTPHKSSAHASASPTSVLQGVDSPASSASASPASSTHSTPTHSSTQHSTSATRALFPDPIQPITTQPAKARRRPRLPNLSKAAGFVQGVGRSLRPHLAKAHIPPPVAMAVGTVLGVVLYMTKIRPHLEVVESDAPCAVGACFRQDAYDRFRARYSSL